MIRKLRLKEGDIVVVRDRYTLDRLMKVARTLIDQGVALPNCPIIVCEGSIHRLSKEYLRKLIKGDPK